jgi:hypothetical protein
MKWNGKITPFYPFNRGLAWPQSRSGSFGEEINLLLVLGFETVSGSLSIYYAHNLSEVYNLQF